MSGGLFISLLMSILAVPLYPVYLGYKMCGHSESVIRRVSVRRREQRRSEQNDDDNIMNICTFVSDAFIWQYDQVYDLYIKLVDIEQPQTQLRESSVDGLASLARNQFGYSSIHLKL